LRKDGTPQYCSDQGVVGPESLYQETAADSPVLSRRAKSIDDGPGPRLIFDCGLTRGESREHFLAI
jgi:hypothetical protein